MTDITVSDEDKKKSVVLFCLCKRHSPERMQRQSARERKEGRVRRHDGLFVSRVVKLAVEHVPSNGNGKRKKKK